MTTMNYIGTYMLSALIIRTSYNANLEPVRHASDKEMAERIYGCIEELDEEKKQIIYLHFYQGLSLRDSAFVLDEAPSTVRYRFRKAMRHLRSKIE